MEHIDIAPHRLRCPHQHGVTARGPDALTQQGVHIITVNDYLARRDCEWMSPIYHAL